MDVKVCLIVIFLSCCGISSAYPKHNEEIIEEPNIPKQESDVPATGRLSRRQPLRIRCPKYYRTGDCGRNASLYVCSNMCEGTDFCFDKMVYCDESFNAGTLDCTVTKTRNDCKRKCELCPEITSCEDLSPRVCPILAKNGSCTREDVKEFCRASCKPTETNE